jgi:acyl transferase domain-containing protein
VPPQQAEARALLEKEGLSEVVEVACVNSPSSTVLAADNDNIAKAEAAIPANVFRAYVPGNIPFHSSLTEPILDELRHRLSFLNGTSESKSEHSEVS